MKLEFAELSAVSNFSFLYGASHPEEIVLRASKLGYRAIAITDMQSLSGIVRGHFAAKDVGIKFVTGSKISLKMREDEKVSKLSVSLYPKNIAGYRALCKLLTNGNLRSEKGSCSIFFDDLLALDQPLDSCFLATVFVNNGAKEGFGFDSNLYEVLIRRFLDLWSTTRPLSIALNLSYSPRERDYVQTILDLSSRFGLSLIATSDVLYHEPERRPLHDVISCIRWGTSLERAGFKLQQNADRYLKTVAEINRRYYQFPEAIRRTIDVSEQISFSLDELKYQYPNEICPPGVIPIDYLRDLAFKGALSRYEGKIPEKIATVLNEELSLIQELQYEHYFLTCYDIVKFAQSREILCQGRGAAANSAVCYCLGITSVDPTRIELLFARFVSKERNEPPDIDIDFEHERREEVIQYIYEKYGRHRAGLVSNVVTYRHRSAVREVGKALSLSLETVDILAKLIHRWNRCEIPTEDLLEAGLSPDNPTIKNCLLLSEELIGFPRHLSQHVGGFIISETPLNEIVPILNSGMESRTIIEWNKDDIELLGMLKIDVLALGMLTCIRKAIDLINEARAYSGGEKLAFHSIPAEDPKVYDMICDSDTIGVFQIESRAQMSMLPRLQPRCFYDLVIEVAIVRPGPIQGNMVHPYLKRRAGIEAVDFPDEQVRAVLGKTLGVPIFQEQAMRLAIVVAGFSPGEAEKLRRAMASWKRNKEAIASFQERIVSGMMKKGYSFEFANTCVEQMKGFSEYGFPESHAASFALLVYVSSWIKCHYPAQFAAALLNSQPMGFYSPSQIVQDAARHGVNVLPIDVSFSEWDCIIERSHNLSSLRLGMRLARGVGKEQANFITHVVKIFPEMSLIKELFSLAKILGMPIRRETLAHLARADAYKSFHRSQREALWEIKALPQIAAPLDSDLKDTEGSLEFLPKLSIQQSMFLDFASTGLSLKAHPIELFRSELSKVGIITAKSLRDTKPKAMVSVAGLVVCRQRPHTARGVVFLSLEDETGISNIIVRPHLYESLRKFVTSSIALIAKGRLERTGKVSHVIASSLTPISAVPEVDVRSYSY